MSMMILIGGYAGPGQRLINDSTVIAPGYGPNVILDESGDAVRDETNATVLDET